MPLDNSLQPILKQLKAKREAQGVTEEVLESKLILGNGWIKEFESGKTVPRIDIFISILNELGLQIGDIDFSNAENVVFERNLWAQQDGDNLVLMFPYGKFEAKYILPNASEEEFNEILITLRNGLARVRGEGEEATQIKADAVANTFLKAIELWPHVNPSDLWWFVVYRAFLDPYNHPATWAKLNLDQSWKRTGGWALEKILVGHYSAALAEEGIKLFIADSDTKHKLLDQVISDDRMVADKADVLSTSPFSEQVVSL